ncbi:MAG TPA: YncE family protein [Alphaproteobacteria bacterium]|nr:YncE family protein [Alphaproteobacteria bacterium]
MARSHKLMSFGAVVVLWLAAGMAVPAAAQHIIVGNDEKLLWDDAGKGVLSPAGKDTLSIIDIRSPLAPRIVANLKLENSVVGPPVNLQITPDGKLALLANSLDVESENGALKSVPATDLFVIDLTTKPPALIATVKVGRQPSGLAISPKGDLALVTNRADNSISVLTISGKEVKVVDTVAMGDSVSAVSISPDGKRALAAKYAVNKIAVLDIDGSKVTYGKYDFTVGVWPYNVQISPRGDIALAGNQGNGGASDGGADSVAVIDMKANPPRVIDYVAVGDAPEGLVFSPNGRLAVTVNLNGSGAGPKNAWYHHRNATVSVLRVDGRKVRRIGDVAVRGLAEGAAFSPDGKVLYVGNYLDQNLSILKVDGLKVTNTGKTLKLPGHPASVRGNRQ